MSQSFGRSRRPSPLLHEIQPPSRRLSAHQMLLLTPFGGAIPPGELIRPVEGVARIASSIGASLSLLTAPQRSFGSSSAMRVALGSIGPPRLRHHSLVNPPAAPSPLSSAPMTTIQSASEYSSSESASNASQEGIPNQGENSTTGTLGTVAMTRSNSGPVLTLRELQALQQKDGELGIARGGEWAWMSREGTDDESIDESSARPQTHFLDFTDGYQCGRRDSRLDRRKHRFCLVHLSGVKHQHDSSFPIPLHQWFP